MKRWIAFALMFLLAGCVKQTWVAKVGNTIIYEEDVSERIARGMPRESALDELIGEALMYNDALEKGYLQAGEDEIERAVNGLTVRRLYENVVLKKIQVNSFMIKNYWNKLNKEVRARKISVRDREKAKKIYRRLIIGENFEELAREKSEDRATASKGGDLGWLDYKSQIEPELVERIFSLRKGKFSRPFQSDQNWFIVMVEDIRFKEDELTKEDVNRIRQELSRQRESRLASDYPEHLKRLARINFNEELVKNITESLAASGLPDTTSIDPSKVVMTSIIQDITLRDFVRISEPRRRPPFNDPENIKIFLSNYLIYEVLLPLEARRFKIHKYPDIEKEIETRRRGIVLRIYQMEEIEKYIREPNDSQIETYYNENIEKFRDPARAKVKIIETETENEAKEARQRLMNGEDFSGLAREVSIHASNTRGGNLGWVRKGQYRELDQKIFTAKLNEVTSPFRISTGWCIVLVDDRKEERIKPLNEVTRQVISEIKSQVREEMKGEILEQLKKKYIIEINRSITTTPIT